MAIPITRMLTCPSNRLLQQLVTGSLSEDNADALFAHLETCDACQQRMDALSRDVRDIVTAAKQTVAKEVGPQLSELIRKAQNLGRTTAEEPPVVREPVSLDGFVSGLRRCGLFDDDEVDGLLTEHKPGDSSTLARQLVLSRRLTRFQARVLLKGRWKGLVLGNYVILDKLGQGGMGSVYKARHRRLGRIVCLKVVNSSARKSPKMLERFRNEARTVAALDHPNFVVAHDADEAEGIPFLVMEYVEGRDLARDIAASGPLTLNYALKIVQRVAEALQYAHDQGVTHRDIKPHNLLVTEGPDVDGPQVKILDLGLARFDSLLEENMDASRHAALTNTGVIMGTVDYMSPEQALRSRDADNRSDIYSLGCTLYFLVTGRAVFDGDTLMSRLIAHREAEIPSLEKVCPGGPPGLDAVFRRMLAKKPTDRYQTMQEVAEDIDALLHGRTPLAALNENDRPRAPTVMDVHRSRRRRPAWGMWLLVCSLILMLSAGVWYLFGEGRLSAQNLVSADADSGVASGHPGHGALPESPTGDGDHTPPDSQAGPRPALDFDQQAHAAEWSFYKQPQLANGGRARAVAVLGQRFDDIELAALQRACERHSVHLEIAGPSEATLQALHNEQLTVNPTIVLKDMRVADFDLVFVVSGSLNDFDDLSRDKLASFMVSSGGLGRVVAATSESAAKIFGQLGLDVDSRWSELKDVYHSRVTETGGGIAWAGQTDAVDELVNRAVRMRLATLSARKTHQVHEDALAGFGHGRAMIIVPEKNVDVASLKLLLETLNDAGVRCEVTSTRLVDVWSEDGQQHVPVTLTFAETPNLSRVRFSSLFDFVFVIDGDLESLIADAGADVRLLLDHAAPSGSVVCGYSDRTKKVLRLSAAFDASAPDPDAPDALPRRLTSTGGSMLVLPRPTSKEQLQEHVQTFLQWRRQALQQNGAPSAL